MTNYECFLCLSPLTRSSETFEDRFQLVEEKVLFSQILKLSDDDIKKNASLFMGRIRWCKQCYRIMFEANEIHLKMKALFTRFQTFENIIKTKFFEARRRKTTVKVETNVRTMNSKTSSQSRLQKCPSPKPEPEPDTSDDDNDADDYFEENNNEEHEEDEDGNSNSNDASDNEDSKIPIPSQQLSLPSEMAAPLSQPDSLPPEMNAPPPNQQVSPSPEMTTPPNSNRALQLIYHGPNAVTSTSSNQSSLSDGSPSTSGMANENRQSASSANLIQFSSEDEASSNYSQSDDEMDATSDVGDEDPVFKAIMMAKERTSSNHPPDLHLDCAPSTLSFHPEEDKIAFGNNHGHILLYKYSPEVNALSAECLHESNSTVTAMAFTEDGEKLISCYSDRTIKVYDVRMGLQLERTINHATPAPVTSIHVINEHMFTTGDDQGHVSLWDNRNEESISSSVRLGEAAITSMTAKDDLQILVCTSKDGATHAVTSELEVKTKRFGNHGFKCSCKFNEDSAVAVGDDGGNVYVLYSDDEGDIHSDVRKGIGRGQAINAMIPITEEIIITGGDDGVIRAFNFLPRLKYLGRVGNVGYPVKKMDVSSDGKVIATIGPERTVKFWNVSYFENAIANEV